MPTIIADLGDLHVNQTVAVCPPVVNLDDGGTYHASRTQRWLHECLQDYTAQFYAIEGRHIVFLKGDVVELDCKRRSVQLVSPNKATIESMVQEVLDPIVNPADKLIVIRGTAAHTGKSSWSEEKLAADYSNTLWYRVERTSPSGKKKGIASWWHFQGKIDKVPFDISHHAPMPGDQQNYPKAAIDLAKRALWHYRVILQQEPPAIISRSHNHRFADSYDNFETRAIFTGAWTVMPEYGYRSGKELSVSHIGGMIYIIDNGKVEAKKIQYHPKESRRVWATKV
jgi:hypothetical protein